MLKHIVLFKVKESVNSKTAGDTLLSIKNELMALKTTVPTLRDIEVGINENNNETFDLSLISVFDSWSDLEKYVVHPAHQEVAGRIREVLVERACVDYEY